MIRGFKNFWVVTVVQVVFFFQIEVLYASEPPVIVDTVFERKPQIQQQSTELPDLQTRTESLSSGSSIVIKNIEIQGGTVFSLEQVSDWLQPIIGKEAKRELLIEVLNNITTAYSKSGFPLSYASIPSGQDLSSGKIIIRLVEGYVARSEVEVDSKRIEDRIERYVTRMMQERPLSKKTFERYVSLIEATPGYKFHINVPKPMSATGATTIRVEQVEKELIQPSLALDNSDSNRILASVGVNSSTSYADQLTIAGLFSNDVDKFYSATYSQFINDDGLTVQLGARYYKSDETDRFSVVDIPMDYFESKTREEYSIGLSYPLELSQTHAWWVGSKIHHFDEASVFKLRSQSSFAQINKDLKYSAVEAYTSLLINTSKSVRQASVALKQGVDLGANQNELGDSSVTVSGAENLYFTYLTTELFWRSRVAKKWQIQTRLHGQWTDDILPSAEQDRYGNILFARGYPEGQAQGDRGYAGEVELRYIHPLNTTFIKQIEPYFIVDAARTHLLSNGNRSSLSSSSVGIAFTDNRYYGLSMEYSVPTGDLPIDSNRRSGVVNLRVQWQL
ncbi:ShlB/FhaC/HecB family hemolysin secretion/activation protein [Neptuniibacter marinus]|uniref:ShlB/FhaC/HecB family hemolysin secretion/activation protein n=1 Tax=Neptuniibacter marinus TaxID=1806670 RepID=UPI003B5A012F